LNLVLSAFGKALVQTFDRELRGILWRVIGLTLVAIVCSWTLLVYGLGATALVETGWLDRVLDWLGWAAGVVLAIVLFPALATMFASLYQDRIAALVERRHYPDLGPVAGVSISAALAAGFGLLAASLLLNLVLLPLYFVIGANLLVYLAANGYLLGREYFAAVALRRLNLGDARRLRRRHRGGVWLGGVAIAALFALPVVNLAAPVIGTAMMVHVFETLLRNQAAAAVLSR